MSTHRKLFQILSILVILTMLFSGLALPSVSAQGADGIQRQVNTQTGKVSFIGAENGRAVSASKALGTSVRPQNPAMALAKRFGPELGLKNAERDLSEIGNKHSENGRITVRYQQKYAGIPVIGGVLIVNTNKNGDLYSINGEVSSNLSLGTQPTIDSKQARETALHAVAKWYQKAPEDFAGSNPELWIYDESLLQPSTRPAELVWRMEVTAVDNSLPVRELMLVNAHRGNISLHFNQIDTAWALKGSSGTVDPTATPLSIETPLPTKTPEPVVTEILVTDEANSNEDSLASGVWVREGTTPVAAIWYVAPTGNDSNSCSTLASPCATINSAIEKAVGGDTILIAEGTYFSNNPSGYPRFQIYNKPLTLSGGWDDAFSSQSGISILDGKKDGTVLSILYNASNVTIDHLIMQNGTTGLGIEGSTNVIIRRSSVYGNNGWGMSVSGGNVVLENSTVSGNRNTGIYQHGGTINIINSTITGNSSSGNPSTGGIFGNSISIQNSILSGNTKDGNPSDCYGTIMSLGNNIIGTRSGCSLMPQVSDLVSVNPQMGLYLGSGYHPLFSNSPAIDAGNAGACAASDQRGVSRLIGDKCDIGAYEYQAPGPAARVLVQSGSYQVPGLNAPLSLPIKALVLDSAGSPVAGQWVTFLAPASGASGVFAASGANQTTAITDSNGIATASVFTTNSIAGTFEVSASVSGISKTARFFITYTALYVKPGGNNSLDCLTPATACATINEALNKAPSNAKILVAGGTYIGTNYQVVNVNKSIFLSGGWDASFSTQNEQSIIDGQNLRDGIFIWSNNVVNIDRFIIKNSGHGIKNAGGTVTLLNSSLMNNQIGVNNQGTLNATNITSGQNSLYGIANHRTLTIQNSTIVDNAGGIYNGSYVLGTTTIQNSILAENDENCSVSSGSITSTGYNIIDSTTGCAVTTLASDLIGADPQLITLSNLGLYILKATSPAIDAANRTSCPATDQRGVARPVGAGCDIGAVEYHPVGTIPEYILVYGGAQQDVAFGNPAASPLKAFVFDKNGDSVPGISVRFTAPVNGASATFTDTGTNITTAMTDANGVATSSGFSANTTGGSYTIKGTIDGLQNLAEFQLFNYDPNLPTTISVISGSEQSALPQTQFLQPLTVKVQNYVAQPVSGKTVTFMGPSSGASINFLDTGTNAATAVTDANGIATSSTFKANTLRGDYIVSATVTNLANSADFQLSNSAQVKTYTANNTAMLPGALLCDQSAPTCTGGTNRSADGAHKYAIGAYKFYITAHKRDSFDNNGMTVISTVDYCDPDFACPYSNAFWNGEQIVYGNAYGYSLADDVVAHEFTHGVTQYESNLFYYYQSGAINESFSDLWGEYYDQSNGLGNDAGGVKWQIGEDASAPGLRSMSNPPAYADPDKMTSTNYYRDEGDNGGVHTNSGVNNKAVYLMVDGGNFNGKAVSALGWEKTAAIYYEVNTNLLFSGADYSDLYYALQQACTNLIGQKGITAGDCAEVKDAVDAVEMNGQPAPNFNTDAPLCSGITPVIAFADDLETGTANWTFTNGAYTRWKYDSPYGQYAQSGQHFLYADDYPGIVTDASARLVSLTVPNNGYLYFAHAYDFETGYNPGDPTFHNFDGGVLEYSLNNGATWTDAGSLIEVNGYKGTLFTGADNPLSGRSAFVGSSHGYISTRLNLDSLGGKMVTFRWRMGLDKAVSYWGWWVDNIKVYTCGAPNIFNDVSNTYWAWNYVERLYSVGITGGCGINPLRYCPEGTVTRSQMAVFLLRGIHSSSYNPPAVGASTGFGDVPPDYWSAAWIKQLAAEGITGGCGSGNYCPEYPVTRDQMAVFLLRSKYGSSYSPPGVGTSTGFGDVPTDHWAAPWIKQLVTEGITAGCGNGNYCPGIPVSRAQMAVFLVRTFNLP